MSESKPNYTGMKIDQDAAEQLRGLILTPDLVHTGDGVKHLDGGLVEVSIDRSDPVGSRMVGMLEQRLDRMAGEAQAAAGEDSATTYDKGEVADRSETTFTMPAETYASLQRSIKAELSR